MHRSAALGTGAGISRNRPPSGVSSPVVSTRRTLPSPRGGGRDSLHSTIGSQLGTTLGATSSGGGGGCSEQPSHSGVVALSSDRLCAISSPRCSIQPRGRESLADRLGQIPTSPKASHSHNTSAQSSPSFSGSSTGSALANVNLTDALPPGRSVEPPLSEIRTTGGRAAPTPAPRRGSDGSASSSEVSDLRRSKSTNGSILWETAAALSRAASPVMEPRSPRLPAATTTAAPGAGSASLAISASRLLLSASASKLCYKDREIATVAAARVRKSQRI